MICLRMKEKNVCNCQNNWLKCSGVSQDSFISQTSKLYAIFHFLLDFQAQLHFLLQTVLLSCSVIACLCNLSYNSNPHS